ncbi:hypothetical protein [Mogibacterium pumilum]|uniref:Uncharacterized protein n=1 Tax=Mogibacterium pumilum TaxID=86332 RepID=A0A223ATZ2_9FIRM|nr:hypothetical protein [Mogibacterium pumilum]ASS38463.1 hypothetical protein AXF17_08735 [Mogibacterium pumilum]
MAAQSQCYKEQGHKTIQIKISRFWILERQRRVEGKTSPRLNKAIQEEVETVNQAVAKTTGLHLISKEILAKRGLISCLDYYLG